MLIYDLLTQDHRMVINIINTLEQTADPDRRKDIFSFLRTELVMHSKAEEEVLYRHLRELTSDNALIDGSFDDHNAIEKLLLELQTTAARDKEFMERVQKLRSIIERHVAKEESDVFALAKQHYSKAEAEDMAARMMEEKGKLGMENPLAVISRKVKEMVE